MQKDIAFADCAGGPLQNLCGTSSGISLNLKTHDGDLQTERQLGLYVRQRICSNWGQPIHISSITSGSVECNSKSTDVRFVNCGVEVHTVIEASAASIYVELIGLIGWSLVFQPENLLSIQH
ncbi:hypothetical protein R1flu_025380 [Riccia fluitans]|uniref:Uncharacterized protein n=1 Tax=Riccia fluitans TaxID=41844 RepID=A0ABD1XXK5_9MARC